MDLDKIHVILATDCGSTTTKAILIEKVDGVYRQTYRGEAPTTVEEPVADVTVGVINAATEVRRAGRPAAGRTNRGELIRPARGSEGCDIYISTSSAGGGLQMMVAGIVREMTAASAKRAALGAGAIVMDVIAANDKRLPHEQIQRIRELRPDMILVSGGTDGGNTAKVVRDRRADRSGPAAAAFRQELRMPADLRRQQGRRPTSCAKRWATASSCSWCPTCGRCSNARIWGRRATASTTCSSST